MSAHSKYDKILDALEELLAQKNLQTISVSEIAQAAGIGKGSIYYYFPSKNAIFEALVERNYESPLKTAKKLAGETGVSPFTRMAMIFQACRSSSSAFSSYRGIPSQEGGRAPEDAAGGKGAGNRELEEGDGAAGGVKEASAAERQAGASQLNVQETALLHQKYMGHLISELKPVLTEIIRQGIGSGEIHFDRPAALAEIVLIVLTVKLDNTIVPSSAEDIEETLLGLISLLEKGTGNPTGSLNFLTL